MNRAARLSYAHLLRRAGVRYAFAAATLARLSYATVSLALIFAVQAATGSFAAAGAVLAAYGVPVVASPLIARLVDRWGRLRVLVPLSIGYSASLLGIAACAAASVTSTAAYVTLAAVAGLTAPPVGPVMRQLWAAVTATAEDRQRAYSLDTVSEEAVFAIGPLAVGLLVTLAGPVAALLASALLALVGSVGLAAVPLLQTTPAEYEPAPARRWLGPLISPGFRWVAVVMLAVGLGMAPLEVAVAARATEAGSPAAAGYLLAVLSITSVAGGLLWGRIRHRRPPSLQLVRLLAALAVGNVAAGLVQPLVAIAAVLALTGLAISPVFVVTFLMADDLVPPTAQVEASTWLTTTYNLGGAAGALTAGLIIDQHSAQLAFLLGGAVLGITAAALVSAAKHLDTIRTSHRSSDT